MKPYTVHTFRDIEYRVLGSGNEFELQYKAPRLPLAVLLPPSLSNEWKYCGDYESEAEALKYAEKRSDMLADGESVML